jgi:hypothetical protein
MEFLLALLRSDLRRSYGTVVDTNILIFGDLDSYSGTEFNCPPRHLLFADVMRAYQLFDWNRNIFYRRLQTYSGSDILFRT